MTKLVKATKVRRSYPVAMGEEPMPATWDRILPWMFSPFRVFLGLANLATITFVVLISQISIGLGIMLGICLAFLMERVREEPRPLD